MRSVGKKTLSILLTFIMMIGMVISVGFSNTFALTPSYSPSNSYKTSNYYKKLCAVNLTGNQRNDIAAVALSQEGYYESNSADKLSGADLGSGTYNNYTEYGYWFGKQTAWCAIFISWCAAQAGVSTSIINKTATAKAQAFCGTYYSFGSVTPQVGDIIALSTDNEHVGLIYKVDNSFIYTIEGNMRSGGTRVSKVQYSKSTGKRTWDNGKSYESKGIALIACPKYSSSSSNTPCTTHTKGEYQYYWAAHPHYKCYKCSKCGEVFNTTETTYVSSCSTCSSHTHQKGAYQYYWAAHPHYKCYKCTVCGETYNTSETTYLSSCSTCTAKPVVTVSAGTTTTNTKISFTKNSMASQHDIHIYYSDGTRYKVIGAVNSPYSLVLPKGQFSIYAIAIVEGNQIWSDRVLTNISDPTYKLTINYYSNYADKAFSGSVNTVGADKNVIVKSAPVGYTDTVTYGLPDYSYSGSSTYLGRTGYTATGYWNTKPDGSGYRLSESEENITGNQIAKRLGVDISTGNKTINLYPEWNQNELTINYYSNYADKSFSNPLNAVGADKNVIVKSAPVGYADVVTYGLPDYSNNDSSTYLGRTGYTCTKNWNTKPDGTGYSVNELTAFSSGQALAQALGKDLSNGNATVNLYPEWKTGVDAPVTHIDKTRYEVGETITFTWERVTNASISNYWLEGYKTDSSPVETIVFEINNSMSKQLTLDEPGEYIITAISITPEEMTSSPNNWQRFTVYTTYNVTLDMNYNSIPSVSQEVPTDLGILLPDIYREGYVLTGWNTQTNGCGTNYEVGSTYKPTGDITLYAIWEKYVCPHTEIYTITKNNVEPTCTSNGGYDEVTYCELCGNEVNSSHVIVKTAGHIYTTLVTTPTCTERGYTTHTCDCGDSYVDSYVNSLGHSFTQYVYNNDATTEKDGTETAKCDRCDETDTRTKPGTKIHVHTYSIDIQAPGCIEKGYTAHTCSCGDYYEDNYVVALGHSFTNYVYNNDATAEKDGTETAKCDRCDETYTRTKPGTKLTPDNPINPTARAKINVAGAKSVDYRAIVTITATATDLDSAYHLVLVINGTEYEGNNKEVSHECGEVKGDINYFVKIVDSSGNIQKDANGAELKKDGGKITCNAGFFHKIIAFFRGLFGLLPNVEIKP